MYIDAASGLATENEHSYNYNYSFYVCVGKNNFNVAHKFRTR